MWREKFCVDGEVEEEMDSCGGRSVMVEVKEEVDSVEGEVLYWTRE